jgi:hypothetical protein
VTVLRMIGLPFTSRRGLPALSTAGVSTRFDPLSVPGPAQDPR